MTLRLKHAVPMKLRGIHDIVIPAGQPVSPCADTADEYAVDSVIEFLRFGTPAYCAAMEHGIRVNAANIGENDLTRRIDLVEHVANVVLARLVELGWARRDWFPAVTKDYETAVGVKTAGAFPTDLGPQEDSIRLIGSYESEGHNVLSTTWATIPLTADVEQIHQKVAEFVTAADAAIAQSYAMKLYALGVRPRQLMN